MKPSNRLLWPTTEKLTNLQNLLRENVACQTQFGFGTAVVEQMYKSEKAQADRIVKMIVLLQDNYKKVLNELEDLEEIYANQT